MSALLALHIIDTHTNSNTSDHTVHHKGWCATKVQTTFCHTVKGDNLNLNVATSMDTADLTPHRVAPPRRRDGYMIFFPIAGCARG